MTPRAQAQDQDTFAMTWEPSGFGSYPTPTMGLRLGWDPPSWVDAEVSYLVGESEVLLAKYETQVLMIRQRIAFSDLLYIHFGVGVRQQTVNYAVETLTSETAATAFLMTSAVEIGFGNKVHLGPVVVGVDWLGLLVPLQTLKEDESFPSNAVTEESSNQELLRAMGHRNTLQFVRPYIGVVF